MRCGGHRWVFRLPLVESVYAFLACHKVVQARIEFALCFSDTAQGAKRSGMSDTPLVLTATGTEVIAFIACTFVLRF